MTTSHARPFLISINPIWRPNSIKILILLACIAHNEHGNGKFPGSLITKMSCMDPLGPIPETIRSVIGSVISRQLTISRSDRIPQMILLRSDHDPGRSCSLRGSMLDQEFHHTILSFYKQNRHS